ncbi:MAG: hypothetical protein HY851_07670 [candidate division Zixibacteria bacterium]|nr:hypothetical protein [candidate division Zixibacteria bacterium]
MRVAHAEESRVADTVETGERDGHGLSALDGTIIDSIVVETRNIYNTLEPRYDRWVFRLANSLHYVTRPKIVRRELFFRVGDPFSLELAEEIARNLRTRLALNDAWVAPEILPNGHLLVRVVTVDKWSLLGGVQVQREGNRTSYQFGFQERNLLGLHQYLSFDYFVRELDNSYVEAKFSDRRLWGNPVMLTLQYSNDVLNGIVYSELAHPYYSLSQRWTYYIANLRISQRNDLYHDSIKAASAQERGDILNLGGGYRWGSYRTKFGLQGDYRYVYTHFYNRRVISPADSAYIVYPQDTLYHRLGLTAQYSSYEFTKVSRLNGMRYTEDLTLGFSAGISIGREFTAHFRDYISDGMGVELSYAARWRGHILMTSFDRSINFRESIVRRRGSSFELKYYNLTSSWMTVALRSRYVSETRSDGGNTLALGGVNGLRGYDVYYRTGDRLHVVNSELRFFPNIELLSVILGGATFLDLGKTWERSGLASRYDYAYGLGIRASLEKLSKGELLRIDLARGQSGNWQLSVASHQYF